MRDSFGDKVFYAINYGLLALISLSCLLPMLHILAISLSNPQAVISGKVLFLPVDLTFKSYEQLFIGTNVVQAFRNNVMITVVGTTLSMIFTVLAAYPLSRPNMYGRRIFTLAIIFTMLFSAGLIPGYLVNKSLGLVNTYGAIWFPALVSAYNMLVLKTYFESQPVEMEEAARMDGCTEWGLLFRIVLPLSMPVLAALTLFYMVGFWNQYMSVLIYINEPAMHNLTVMVQQMIKSQQLIRELTNIQPEDVMNMTPETIKSAGVFVLIVPMLIIYPFLQKYFVKGVMIGAVKG